MYIRSAGRTDTDTRFLIKSTRTSRPELCTPVTASASRRGCLRSVTTSNLVVPRCRLSTYGTRAPCVQCRWSSLLECFTGSRHLSFDVFKHQLKHCCFVDTDTSTTYCSALETLVDALIQMYTVFRKKHPLTLSFISQ